MFELIWIRRLAFAFGCSIEATAAAVAAFMLGLGLGAYASGRWLTRTRWNPVVLFGCLEIFVAASGLGILALLNFYEPLVASLADSSWFPLYKVLLVAVTLILPCSAMGATLPLLTHYGHHTLKGEFAGWLGRLYAINTTGALTGVILTDFLLVERWGMTRCGWLAAGLDCAVGLLALLFARHSPPPTAEELPSEEHFRFLPIPFIALFGSGMSGMLLQIFWTRLTVFLNGVELGAYSIILCTYLLGHLLGAGVAGRLRLKGAPELRTATALTFCFVAACTASTVWLVSTLPRPSLSGDSAQMLLNDMAIMLPATVGLGILFVLASQLVQSEYRSAGTSVGAAYLWNTLGSVVGSLLAGFVLIPWLGLAGSFWATLAFTWGVGLLLLHTGHRPVWAAGLLVLSLLATPLAWRWSLLQSLTRIPPQAVIYQGEDSYGSVTLANQIDLALKESSPTLLVDGFMMAGAGVAARHYTTASAALGLALRPDPSRILVVCLGVGNTLRAATELSQCPIECVELSPRVVQAAKQLDPTRQALDSGRVDLKTGDGRHHLLTTPRRYDIILTEPPPAQNAGAVNLYSREYFQLCRQKLTPGGVVVQWLPVVQLDTSELQSILRGFQEVFPDAYLFHVGGLQLCAVGSDHPLVFDLAAWRKQTQRHQPFLQSVGLAEPEQLAVSLVAGPDSLRQWTSSRPPLTDDWPALHFSRRGAVLDISWLLFSSRLPWQEIKILAPGQEATLQKAYQVLRDLNTLYQGSQFNPPLCLPQRYYLGHRVSKHYPNNPYIAALTLTNPGNQVYYQMRLKEDPTALFEAGRIAYIQGRVQEARQIWLEGLKAAPAQQQAFYQACLGLVELADNRPAEATQWIQAALKTNPWLPHEEKFLQSLLGPSQP